MVPSKKSKTNSPKSNSPKEKEALELVHNALSRFGKGSFHSSPTQRHLTWHVEGPSSLQRVAQVAFAFAIVEHAPLWFFAGSLGALPDTALFREKMGNALAYLTSSGGEVRYSFGSAALWTPFLWTTLADALLWLHDLSDRSSLPLAQRDLWQKGGEKGGELLLRDWHFSPLYTPAIERAAQEIYSQQELEERIEMLYRTYVEAREKGEFTLSKEKREALQSCGWEARAHAWAELLDNK